MIENVDFFVLSQINLAFKEKSHLQMEYDELKKQLIDTRENSNGSQLVPEYVS